MLCFSVVKACLARGLFIIHAFIAVWRVVSIKKGQTSYWLFAIGIGLLIFEGLLSICKRRGREMKWFCPSVFIYLCCIIPPTWVMELDLASLRQEFRQSLIRNGSSTNMTIIMQQEKLTAIPGLQLELNLELSAELWAKVLEQFLLVNLILGRWLLPKGDLTRGQLSQLLLVYIGMAADIVELFEAFKEDVVVDSTELTYAVLALWSWSLMQFTLVLTATKARKPRLGMDGKEDDDSTIERQSCCNFQSICFMDTWAIITTIIFQDGPFLCLRLLLILKYNVVSYLNIFFTCKNSLVLILQLYRMTVLNCETRKETQQTPCTAESPNPKASTKLYYEPNCKFENEIGYYGTYDTKFQPGQPALATEFSRSDTESKEDFWPIYAKPVKTSQRTTKKYRTNPPLQSDDVLADDENRDSVLVAFSQSKGAPWTDICLNLRSGRSEPSTRATSSNDVKLRRHRRSRMDEPAATPEDRSEFCRTQGTQPSYNKRTEKMRPKSRCKRTRSPKRTSQSMDHQNYRNQKLANNSLDAHLRSPQSYYMSTRF